MNHAELVGAICTAAEQLELEVLKMPDMRQARWGRGFPDLVIAGPGGILFREVKMPRDRLSARQWAWAHIILLTGCDWACWTLLDWLDGTVQAQLRAIA